MRSAFKTAALLLLAGILYSGCTGCLGQNTDYTLRVIPPQDLEFPLQGSWEIVSLLQDKAAAAGEPAQGWIGKTLHFTDRYALMGEHLLLNPRCQVKRVEAQDYLLCHQQAFPEDFQFKNTEIEVFTLSDSHLFLCELLRENNGELLMNLFNNSYRVKKIADRADETVFAPFVSAGAATGKTGADLAAIFNTGGPGNAPGKQTGVLLGLRAPAPDEHSNAGEQYRTLWLALTGWKLAPVLETKTILFPRRSGFYRLQVVRKAEGKAEEDFLVVHNILVMEDKDDKDDRDDKDPAAGTPPPEEAAEPALALDPVRWEGKEGYIRRRINYIGNDYVSVEESLKQTSLGGCGGESAAGNGGEENKLQVFAVDSLPAMKAVKISDLAGPEAAAAMEHELRKLAQPPGAKQIVPDLREEDNYGLARKMGYWIFKGRVNYQNTASGGSKLNAELQGGPYGETHYVDYNITAIPPDHVVFYNNLHIPWPRVKNHVPGAVDVFTSPEQDMALVITETEIIVYRMYHENLAALPLERIPLNEGEKVIMAEWALGHYVENWTLTFQAYLAKENAD